MLLKALVLISFVAFLSFSFYKQKNKKRKDQIPLLFGAVAVSGGGLLTWLAAGCPSLIVEVPLFPAFLQAFTLSLILDQNSIIFICVALFVTWSIIEFSHYYMATDPNKKAFINCLILFLLFMLILVSSKRLFILFVGWEGVGILSFILIGWWFTRRDANRAALQAIIYNRLGDSGIILFLALRIIFYKSWDLKKVLSSTAPSAVTNLAAVGLIVAAVGKSAQFLLHPWLPSAMEGPTPVSALLHSSTMVVAGVFLLIRGFPLLQGTAWALCRVRLIGSATAIFAARVALFQFDIKKVVAYSTTRQLGLMVAAIGLGLPYLALFHICTHAFFKALLFLCSGRVIHSFKNDQDLRKIGSATNTAPFTARALSIARLALCGIPFMAGFYSKDYILELRNARLTKSVAAILAMAATLLTAAYSLRVIYFTTLYNPNNPPRIPAREENLNLILPLSRLLGGALIAGWGFYLSLFKFFPLLVPLLIKSLPIIVTIAAFILIIKAINKINLAPGTSFLRRKWYYVQIWHTAFTRNAAATRILGVLRAFDQGWAARIGAQGIIMWTGLSSKTMQKSLSGIITKYLSYTILLITAGATAWAVF